MFSFALFIVGNTPPTEFTYITVYLLLSVAYLSNLNIKLIASLLIPCVRVYLTIFRLKTTDLLSYCYLSYYALYMLT